MKTAYVTEHNRWHHSGIAKVTVKKETDKTVTIENTEVILEPCLYLPSRLNKDKYNIYDSALHALQSVVESQVKRVENSEKQLEKEKERLQFLNDLLNVVEFNKT